MADDEGMTSSNGYDPSAAAFPFAAIVGQGRMKLALLLNAISPAIGGVLIRGERGTAKSTAVRGLAVVLPEITVADCRYGCDPDSENLCERCHDLRRRGATIEHSRRRVLVIDLPVSATEDRVVGTMDLEVALQEGRQEFEPGLLADAHRGILYVDEVNLLDDHLVDTLLDGAASGLNRIERDGVTHVHPAEFILVGTMNPEEGDLRPQLLDRFGLAAEVEGERNPAKRAEIVRRRVAYEENPKAFTDEWQPATDDLRQRIIEAQRLSTDVTVSNDMVGLITHIAIAMRVDGHRADIVMFKAAVALAAWDGRSDVTADDVRRAAELALPHRRRRDPFTPPSLDEDELAKTIESYQARQGTPAGESSDGAEDDSAAPTDGDAAVTDGQDGPTTGTQSGERTLDAEAPLKTPPVAAPERMRIEKQRAGRRTTAEVKGRRGRSVRSRRMQEGDPPDLALLDTIRAAALRGTSDGKPNIKPPDYRINRRTRKVGNLMLFVVDGSGSMAAQRRMALTKSAVLALLADAYKRRDRVGMITFRKTEAFETVPPTTSMDLAHGRMRDLPTGGRTPLAHGLELARQVIGRERARDSELRPIIILLTDGVANVGLSAGSDPISDAMSSAHAIALDAVPALVVDADRRREHSSPLPDLAKRMRATHVRLDALAAGQLTHLIRLATT